MPLYREAGRPRNDDSTLPHGLFLFLSRFLRMAKPCSKFGLRSSVRTARKGAHRWLQMWVEPAISPDVRESKVSTKTNTTSRAGHLCLPPRTLPIGLTEIDGREQYLCIKHPNHAAQEPSVQSPPRRGFNLLRVGYLSRSMTLDLTSSNADARVD